VSSSPKTHSPTCLTAGCSIVFIHGLRGHRRNTWTKDGVYWPQELLSKEVALSHIRVLAFGYDANVANVMGRASLNSLFEHSINLLNGLSRERRQDVVSLV
jgi:protein SERAC1